MRAPAYPFNWRLDAPELVPEPRRSRDRSGLWILVFFLLYSVSLVVLAYSVRDDVPRDPFAECDQLSRIPVDETRTRWIYRCDGVLMDVLAER